MTSTELDSPALEQAQLEEVAARAVRLAIEGGAAGAECTLVQGDEFSVNVRRGEVENLKEAGSRGAGIRVLRGKRTGSAYTSDLTASGVAAMVTGALEIADITNDDPFAGLPDERELGVIDGDLQLYFEDVASLDSVDKINRARAAEAAAFAFDARINNSDGASFDSYTGLRVFANSHGFVHSYRTSSCALSMAAVARESGSMERDYWSTAARTSTRLEAPEYVGRKAAERTIRRLGARKLTTRNAPVMFEARIARSLLSHLFDAVNGSAVYRNASFLAGRLGQAIAPAHVTIVDDATLPGLFGTSPSDDEGVPSRRTVVVEQGALASYLLNTYAARRLGFKTTGNASRGLTGAASIGHGNLYLQPGQLSPEQMMCEMGTGLYVTDLMGFGVDTVTGDYSRGAGGIWVENGEFAYPVSEITIAGTLPEMLGRITLIGSDLEFRSSLASPTILISEMTISGQ